MKALLLIAVVVLVMVILGWITFSNRKDQTTITIDKQEIKKDTQRAVESGREILENLRSDEPVQSDVRDKASNRPN